VALDSNLAALLTVDVVWQSKSGTGGYGEDTWGAPVTLKCYPTYGVAQVPKADGTVYVSEQALYFDASDSRVATFKLGDRFTAPGIGGGQAMEAVAITPEYSPGPSLGAAMTPWIVEVRL
jgi:hypothetical protein